MQKLLERNYQAVVSRGLINSKTKDIDFHKKLSEEVMEVYNEIPPLGNGHKFMIEEITDCLVVCANWLRFHNVDIEKALLDCAQKNERRINKLK